VMRKRTKAKMHIAGEQNMKKAIAERNKYCNSNTHLHVVEIVLRGAVALADTGGEGAAVAQAR